MPQETDRELEALYREGADELPPAQLDAAILTAAGESLVPWHRRPYMAAISTAAVVALAVGLFVLDDLRTLPEKARVSASVPMSEPVQSPGVSEYGEQPAESIPSEQVPSTAPFEQAQRLQLSPNEDAATVPVESRTPDGAPEVPDVSPAAFSPAPPAAPEPTDVAREIPPVEIPAPDAQTPPLDIPAPAIEVRQPRPEITGLRTQRVQGENRPGPASPESLANIAEPPTQPVEKNVSVDDAFAVSNDAASSTEPPAAVADAPVPAPAAEPAPPPAAPARAAETARTTAVERSQVDTPVEGIGVVAHANPQIEEVIVTASRITSGKIACPGAVIERFQPQAADSLVVCRYSEATEVYTDRCDSPYRAATALKAKVYPLGVELKGKGRAFRLRCNRGTWVEAQIAPLGVSDRPD